MLISPAVGDAVSQADKRAQIVKAELSRLIAEKTPNKDSREKLAKYIGASAHTVGVLLYQQRGSVKNWINALLYAWELDAEDVSNRIADLRRIARKKNPLTESDRIWFEELSDLSENEKIYWLKVISFAAKIRSRSKKLKS